MKSAVAYFLLPALVAGARPVLDWTLIKNSPYPPNIHIPIGIAAHTWKWNLTADYEKAKKPINLLNQALTDIGQEGDGEGLEAFGACDVLAPGFGPVPSPDTDTAFLQSPALSSAATGALLPNGHARQFQNLQASNSAYGYMGFITLTVGVPFLFYLIVRPEELTNIARQSYDTNQCAQQCNITQGCSSFNIYFERSPTVGQSLAQAAYGCNNPPSTNVIKCVLWGGYLSAQNANNR
ncbi:hypothetical protein PG985_009619 [Apiospora marii]|uniref:Apple domain-containing protein n=1 Tax=Apiospora marii TaxID=335849 RepID=A0ABR1RFU6_9PEZI